ncbi:MAG: hypothetical protein E7348_00665 [Clostridiales bacterium]|nr:hypothetical protein [Clostridiales bacterium]
MQTVEKLANDIIVYQDDELYTFTSDSILLSLFAKAKKGEVVADFCAGSGVVGLNFYALNSNLINSVTFFEVQNSLFELCKNSIEQNGLNEKCVAINTKLQDIENKYYGLFSLILCNPPYMKIGHGEENQDEKKAICKSEVLLSLDELCLAISKCLKYGGRTVMCHRADRLVEVICAFKKYNIEPKRLQFVCAKNKQPYLIIIEGVKGGKSGITILENIVN